MSNNFVLTMNQKGKKAKSFAKIIKRIEQKSYPISLRTGHTVFLDFALSFLSSHINLPALIIFPQEKEAKRALEDLLNLDTKSFLLPCFSSLTYEGISASEEVLSKRSFFLHHLSQKTPGLYLASLDSLSTKVPSPSYLKNKNLNLKINQEITPQELASKLTQIGYKQVPFLSSLGDFSSKGSILDIFSFPESYRLYFDFDQLTEIKQLDIVDHISFGKIEEICLFPLQEIIWEQDILLKLEKEFPSLKEKSPWFWENLENEGKSRGQDLYFGLIEGESSYLWDFISSETPLFLIDNDQWEVLLETKNKERVNLWEKNKELFPYLPNPEKVFLTYSFLIENLETRPYLEFPRFPQNKEDLIILEIEEQKNFMGNIILFKENLFSWQSKGFNIFLSTESEAQKEKLEFLFRDFSLEVINASFSHSFVWEEEKVALITEKELFGREGNISSSWREKPTQIIDSFVDLKEGSYVVHIQYGIGIFKGIQRKTLGGVERDYFSLEYSGKEIILIPIEQMNLIQQYIHNDGRISLDKIGSKSWEKRKAKAKSKADDIADYLIELYAKRQNTQGFVFSKDEEWQMAFESAFPYNETLDQLKAIEEIKADMESSRPMDRLLCGDVGFGKTEVAMRTAFKAVMSGKQVAFLAPTTILAEQHFENFQERFKNFPVTIQSLSRFTETKNRKEILKNLKEGEVDILIGTHRILSSDVEFKNLGLLIIDEEQRFGVKAKEKLKTLRVNLDILTLSATPIPRTLHISLIKLRDISTLTTPPVNRKAIETIVAPFSEDMVKMAIEKELQRGGQVFYLHNRIETLENVKKFIENLVPYAMVEMAHGRVSGEKLESIMHRFTHNEFQILISTSIIESGIDIPNANTIIIDQAHLYGLAQLYQLRGRVGRRGEEAFAYLLYPSDKSLNENAVKRLEVLSENTSLGSGFKIAMKDLEIRGMGNLLGSEQSGEIESVGLDMYLRLLEEAVASRLGEDSQLIETQIDLSYQGFIPTDYIPSTQEKMEIYKRFASLQREEDILKLRNNLYDRFGSIPKEIEPFFILGDIKRIAEELKIISLIERNNKVKASFRDQKDIPINKFMHLFENYKERVDLIPQENNAFYINLNGEDSLERLNLLRETLSSLL